MASLRTSARRVDGGWTLNGSKMFITNGVRASFLVTAVKTTADGGHHGISFFIVDTGQPGVQASKIEKLGWHASDTALISFDDVFVGDEDLLGAENEGFMLIMANFQWERLLMALGAVAAMQVAYERTVAYVEERNAFGRPLSGFQALRHKLADDRDDDPRRPLRHLRRAARASPRARTSCRRSRWRSSSRSARRST